MIKIAHRGNFNGKNKEKENTYIYLLDAINNGYNVEVDVWYVNGKYYLGHDSPNEEISYHLLKNNKFWIHAKNIECYFNLISDKDIHVFWHDKDPYTFTSKGIKWAYSGIVTYDGIMVMPDSNLDLCYKIKSGQITPLGVCSDDFRLMFHNA